MNKLLISSIITAGILLAGNAQASKIDTTTENNLIKICEAIKSDSALKLHTAIRNSGIQTKQISNGLVCNGADPVSFALANDAQKTAKFMAKRSNADSQKFLAKL